MKKENKSFFQTPLGIFTILIFITIIIYIIYVNTIYSSEYINDVKKNWNDYKCKPSIIPIAGMIGPKGTTASNNLYECFNSRVNGIFNTLMAPFINIINVIMTVLEKIVENLNNITKVIDFIRDSISSIVISIYNEFKEITDKLSKVFKQFVDVFQDIINIVNSYISLLTDMVYSIVSLYNWTDHTFSILNPLNWCFDEYTKIKINDTRYKYIKDIKIGDKLYNNSVVESVLKISANNVKMYNYFGVIVSGSHLVYESDINKWIRVENSRYSKKINNYNKSYIYSLITSNSKIPVYISNDYLINHLNIMFADWYETSDIKNKNKIQDMTLSMLNNENIPRKSISNLNNFNNTWWGFSGDVNIDMYKNNIKKIRDIKIGDKLKNGNKVLAVVEHLIPKDIKLYKCINKNIFGTVNNNIITTGSQIIYDKKLNKWIKVSSSNDYIMIDNNINKLYHIITENNKLSINNQIFTDFYQISSKQSKIIDNFVENKINI